MNMTSMENVKTTIGKDDFLTQLFPVPDLINCLNSVPPIHWYFSKDKLNKIGVWINGNPKPSIPVRYEMTGIYPRRRFFAQHKE
tara:strand:- start:227 stop:478 length:252 start_codon:yes stop_codon:yes gene_type:complete